MKTYGAVFEKKKKGERFREREIEGERNRVWEKTKV